MRQGRKCDATGTSMRYTVYGSRVHTEFTSRRRSAVHKPSSTTRRRPDSAIIPQSGELLFSSTLLVVLVPVAADIRLIIDIHETHEPPKADTPVDNRTCSNASGRCSRCFVSESTRLCSPSLQYSLMMSHLVLQCQNRISGHTRVKFGGKPATQFRTRAELATLQGQRRNTRSEGAARRLTTRGDLACSNAYRRISRCLGASLSQKCSPSGGMVTGKTEG